MANQWHVKYDQIIAGLKAARAADDEKAIKQWRRKLEKWQKGYGAYAPVR